MISVRVKFYLGGEGDLFSLVFYILGDFLIKQSFRSPLLDMRWAPVDSQT